MFPEKHNKQEDRHKKKILWISVSIIGGIIFLFWLFSFSYNIKSLLKEERFSKKESEKATLSEIKDQLNSFTEGLNEIKKATSTDSFQK